MTWKLLESSGRNYFVDYMRINLFDALYIFKFFYRIVYMNEKYEDAYKTKNHFSFGKNWQKFLESLDDEKINEAKKSLVDFLGGENKIRGKTFVDIGCGSGLFSLAAFLLGASRVVSVDIDDFSLECAKFLKEKHGSPKNWKIRKVSALDEDFIKELGAFDVVYSWGVLHHTGDMWRAIGNALTIVKSDGVFYIAIYNKNERYVFEGTSRLWVLLKQTYNKSGGLMKRGMEAVYILYFFLGLVLHGINPFAYVRKYTSLRGMDFYTDIRDWLGGYPYEFASINEMKYFFSKNNFECENVKEVRSLGCNEFLFQVK